MPYASLLALGGCLAESIVHAMQSRHLCLYDVQRKGQGLEACVEVGVYSHIAVVLLLFPYNQALQIDPCMFLNIRIVYSLI